MATWKGLVTGIRVQGHKERREERHPGFLFCTHVCFICMVFSLVVMCISCVCVSHSVVSESL